jgi:Fic family protein
VRTDGDWKGWFRFFLTGVAEIALEAVGQAGTLMDLRERWRGRLADNPKAAQLIDALFVNPYMSVARAQRILKVSNPTARQTVAKLEKLGMLTEITGREWGRLYLARPILRVIEKVEAQRAGHEKSED